MHMLVLFLTGKYNFWFLLFARSIYCTLFLLDCFHFAHGCICVYSMILIIICLVLQLPFVWGSSLVSCFWIIVLISLNAITNHLWNPHSWPEIKPWAFEWEHSKTLDYQRTNPRGYQIVRTHTKETTWIQDSASLNHHLNNKQNKTTNPIISRQDYHLTQPCPSEKNKQTKTQH